MKNEVNTTTENNRLLAEFMNLEYTVVNNTTLQTTLISDLDFSKDWNWLMQVVEKIEEMADWSLELLTTDKKEYQMLIPLSNTNVIVETKIEAVYNACVEFVKWYNKNAVKS